MNRTARCWLATVIALAVSSAIAADGGEAMPPSVAYILTVGAGDLYVGSPALARFYEDERQIKGLASGWKLAATPEDRVHLLRALSIVSRGPRVEPGVYADRPLTDSMVVGEFVEALDDPSHLVRNAALGTLTSRCADQVLASRGLAIVEAVKRHGTVTSLGLLGMTRCEEARILIESDTRFRGRQPYAREAVLAKLGDPECERYLVFAFLSEGDPEKQERLAEWLGYVATPGAVAALASRLKTKAFYYGSIGRREYVRDAIVKALRRALPRNPLFGSGTASLTEEQYRACEEWAETVMQVKWDEPAKAGEPEGHR